MKADRKLVTGTIATEAAAMVGAGVGDGDGVAVGGGAVAEGVAVAVATDATDGAAEAGPSLGTGEPQAPSNPAANSAASETATRPRARSTGGLCQPGRRRLFATDPDKRNAPFGRANGA